MTLREQTREAALSALQKLIARKARTAGELADALSVTRATVYAQLAELQKRGARLALATRRTGARGPLATTFQLERK